MDQLDDADLLFLVKNGLGKTEKKYEHYTRNQLKDLISSDLRRLAGHGLANLFRLYHEFSYKQMLIDVADKLSEYRNSGYQLDDDHTEEEIERRILRLFELKTKAWWKRLSHEEQERFVDEVNRAVTLEMLNSVNKRTYIKHRISKELMNSIFTKGIIIGMLAVSAGGVVGLIGGSVLSQIGWSIIVRTMGLMTGIKIMISGVGWFSGKAVFDLVGGLATGLAVFAPSTAYFYLDADYKRTIPTIIMLLSKVHLDKRLGHGRMKDEDEG